MILREFGDGILKKVTTTGVKGGSTGMPEAWGTMRNPTERVHAQLKEQFAVWVRS